MYTIQLTITYQDSFLMWIKYPAVYYDTDFHAVTG